MQAMPSRSHPVNLWTITGSAIGAELKTFVPCSPAVDLLERTDSCDDDCAMCAVDMLPTINCCLPPSYTTHHCPLSDEVHRCPSPLAAAQVRWVTHSAQSLLQEGACREIIGSQVGFRDCRHSSAELGSSQPCDACRPA